IGPYIALDLTVKLYLGAKGQIEAGFTLGFPTPEFSIDLADLSKSTASGWTPDFTPIFNAKGNLTLAAAFAMPLSINFGIDVLKGKFEKDVMLSESPTVTLSVTESGAIAYDPNTGESREAWE